MIVNDVKNIFLVILILNSDNSRFSYAGKKSTISLRMPEHGKKWEYGDNWPSLGYTGCGMKSQSPIRISTTSAVSNNSLIFKLTNYDKIIKSAYIENNGHSVQMGFSDGFEASIVGTATDNEQYIFEQLHFHWGSYDKVGSEHIIDGIRYPMEMHLVHYKASYGSFDQALDQPDGLVVLGVLFRISPNNNKFVATLLKSVKAIPKYKDKVKLMGSLSLKSLLPAQMKPFYSYHGSLTTPPCYESVKWIVFQVPVDVSSIQEKQFRKCRGPYISSKSGRKKPLSNNYRPVQAINLRQIHLSE